MHVAYIKVIALFRKEESDYMIFFTRPNIL